MIVQKIVKIRKNLRQRREKLLSSYHIKLHQISDVVSYNIACSPCSYHISTYHIPSYHIISYHITPHLVSLPILLYPII
jgi:hypothetical protein